MALKRKIEFDADDVLPHTAKQLKLIPFPNVDSDDDVAMSDAEPLYPEIHHSRLSSNASSNSSDTSDSPVGSSPAYPTFDIYPMPFFNSSGSVNTNSHNYAHYAVQPPSPPVGLLQPSSSFAHHGSSCSQVPKLRVACAPGLNGQRTLWSFCEQCGAISMVENDS